MKLTTCYHTSVVALLAFAGGQLFAQTAPTAAANPPAPAAKDEIIELSPFTVNASEDVGYQGVNTTSGSRLGAKLKDTSAPISVFTPEFIADFGLTNIEEMLSYSANFEKDYEDSNAGFNNPSGRGSGAATSPFRVRGLIGAFAVDLIESAVPSDNYNVDRVELSSGPNSVLFGLGAAGGTVALTSKSANLNKTKGNLKVTTGSWDYQRFEADYNQVLIKKTLAFRLNGLIFDREGWRDFDYAKSRRAAGAVTYKPWANGSTVLKFGYDGGTYGQHIDWNWPPANNVTAWLAAGRVVKDGFTAATDNPAGISQLGNNPIWTFFDNNGTTLNLQQELQSNQGAVGLVTDGQFPAADMPYTTSSSGPASRLWGNYRNYNAKFEHKLGDLVIEGAYLHTFNKASANGWAVPGNAISVRGDPNLNITNTGSGLPAVANPFAGRIYIENTWRPEDTEFKNDVFRLTAAYEKDLGRWGRHKIAALAETGKVDQIKHIYQEILVDQAGVPVSNAASPENANNQLFRRHYVTEGVYNTYYQGSLDVPLAPFAFGTRQLSSRLVANGANGNSQDQKITDTLMLATQNYFWKDRVITTLGYRSDDLKFKNGRTARLAAIDDPLVTSGQKILNEFAITKGEYDNVKFKPHTFTAGAVVHVVRDRVSVFYNQSNNVGAPGFTRRVLPGGVDAAGRYTAVQAGLTDGTSKDMGLSFDLLGDNKYTLKLTRFDSQYLGDTPVQPGNHPFQPGTPLAAAGAFVPTATTLLGNNAIATQTVVTGMNILLANGRITTAQRDVFSNLTSTPNAFSIDVRSKGYELEFIANPIKQLTIRAVASYSDRDRENFFQEQDPYVSALKSFLKTVDSSGLQVVANGTTGVTYATVADYMNAGIDQFITDTTDTQLQAFGSRPYKFNFNTRYAFDRGVLKGLAVGGAVRWQSKNYMQKDTRITLTTNGVTAPNPEYGREYFGLPFENWDFFATYKTRLPFVKNPVTLQVNVRNAFDQSIALPAKLSTDLVTLRRVYLSEPRSVKFSVNMEF